MDAFAKNIFQTRKFLDRLKFSGSPATTPLPMAVFANHEKKGMRLDRGNCYYHWSTLIMTMPNKLFGALAVTLWTCYGAL